MSQISDIEQKGLIDALDIKQDDLFEAKFNLLGFFGALYKIDQRLRNEKKYFPCTKQKITHNLRKGIQNLSM